ncbi:nuclear transport factor 2 family protein [Acetobacteraceae bacterium H6797]|nr:nuclear transport factor 2 family protein [Acetobacteraceae bacterium H6797]
MSPLEGALAGMKEGQAILGLLARFQAGFAVMDQAALLACFAPGAVFMGTTMPAPTTEPAGIAAYFAAAGAKDMPKRLEFEQVTAMEVGEGLVLLAGQQSFWRDIDREPRSTPARFTLLLRRETEAWRILHFHSSARP